VYSQVLFGIVSDQLQKEQDIHWLFGTLDIHLNNMKTVEELKKLRRQQIS
jgi:hypothetical protein